MAEPWYDIVIVGAGLAGLAAADELSRHNNLRLLLVDARRKERTHTALTFADTIADFGLEKGVLHTYQSFSMQSPLGSRSLHRFQEATLVALDYGQACRLMAGRLADRTSLQRTHARVMAMQRTDQAWQIALGSGEMIRCALVIDASGRAQLSAEVLGYSRSRLYSHCYGERLEGCPVDDEAVCYFLGGSGRFGTGGGWFYPLGDDLASFGYAWVTKSPHYPASMVQEGYRRAVAFFEPYASIVAAAECVTTEAGSIPVGPSLPLVGNGLLRVGDAAGQATPWMCMGIEPALVNGALCGRVATQACQDGAFQASDLQTYQLAWKQANWRPYRQAMLVAPTQWVKDEEQWDRAIAAQNRFTADEMLAKLRNNYPTKPLAKLWWFRLYYTLGRLRRGIRDQIRRWLPAA